MDRNRELSVVLPVFNEAGLLPELHRRLSVALAPIGIDYELVFVDDGSTDGSAAGLEALVRTDVRARAIFLSRNFGHQIAITAGLDHARGRGVVLMDSDLQDPPELLPEMVAHWRAGAEIVAARRRRRPGESWFKRATAYLFYRLFARITTVPIAADTGDFCLLSPAAADALRACREQRRFVRGLVAWSGFARANVLYDRPPRSAGESKYRLRQMLRLALQAAFAFSDLPVKMLGLAGALVCAASLAALAFGAAPLVAGLYFLGGVQLLGLWVIGQYVSAIAEHARNRPLYVVRAQRAPPAEARPRDAD